MLQTPKVVQVPHWLKGLQSRQQDTEHTQLSLKQWERLQPLLCSRAHRRTLTLVLCLVVVAGLIGDPMFVSVLPNAAVIPSMARASVTAVDHILDGEIGGRPRSFPLNVDAICSDRKWLFEKI